jgi:hypothetical protein
LSGRTDPGSVLTKFFSTMIIPKYSPNRFMKVT